MRSRKAPSSLTGRRVDAQHPSLAFDGGQHLQQLEPLPAVNLVEDRPANQDIRGCQGVRVDVGRQDDLGMDPHARSIGTDVQNNSRIFCDGDFRSGIAYKKLASGAGFEVEVLGKPAAVCRALRAIVRNQPDDGVRLLALHTGC